MAVFPVIHHRCSSSSYLSLASYNSSLRSIYWPHFCITCFLLSCFAVDVQQVPLNLQRNKPCLFALYAKLVDKNTSNQRLFQVNRAVRACFLQLKSIDKRMPFLSFADLETAIPSFIPSCLYHCNKLHSGLNQRLLSVSKIQARCKASNKL